MSTETQAAWPRNGFEPLFGYVSDFIHLNINLGGPTQCKAYHDRWMRRYSTAMANWSDFDVAVWSVRLRQSLKLAFSATFFALSADVIGARKIKAAEYYLAYYAMLHAMWAVIYLHPEQSIEHVTSITHSKMSKLFHAEFASGTGRVIVEDVKALAEDLRFLREYYSYRMPLNSPFDAHSELSLSYARLGGFIKQSIQLANLHSHMIRKIGERTKKAGARIAPNDVAKFSDAFYEMNAKKHIGRDYLVLDNPDSRARTEFLVHGCDLLPLSIGYDHMFDNFMTWDHERPDEKLLQRVRALVGGALF